MVLHFDICVSLFPLRSAYERILREIFIQSIDSRSLSRKQCISKLERVSSSTSSNQLMYIAIDFVTITT